jgi:hypothetical protein
MKKEMASRDQKHEKERQSLREKMMDLVNDKARLKSKLAAAIAERIPDGADADATNDSQQREKATGVAAEPE